MDDPLTVHLVRFSIVDEVRPIGQGCGLVE